MFLMKVLSNIPTILARNIGNKHLWGININEEGFDKFGRSRDLGHLTQATGLGMA